MDNTHEKIENKIIDAINLEATGRLVISKPEQNSSGVDLIIQQRGDYKEKGASFKINEIKKEAGKGFFSKELSVEDFKPEKNFYLLFVYFNEVKQQIDDYIWLIPSQEFRDLSETVQLGNKKKFKFSASCLEKDRYSRFLMHIKKLGSLTVAALEAKGIFKFEGGEPGKAEQVDAEKLKEFLIEARRSVYASNGVASDNPRLLGSSQLEFQKGPLFYINFYFSGEKKYVGQEIVYQNLRPIWGMHYSGSPLGKTEESFLKESLFRLVEKCRLGEECEYEKREYKYQNHGKGSMAEFSGQENIFSGGKIIYSLQYLGGLI